MLVEQGLEALGAVGQAVLGDQPRHRVAHCCVHPVALVARDVFDIHWDNILILINFFV